MEWWQYLVGSIVSLLCVLVGVFVGYWLNRRGMESERAATTARELEGAIRAILAEVQANQKIAKEPFDGRLLPFLTEMWTLYKAQTGKLPEDVAQPLHKLYIDIIRANTIVNYDLQKIVYGRGYVNNEYKGVCSGIANQATSVAGSLEKWLETRTA